MKTPHDGAQAERDARRKHDMNEDTIISVQLNRIREAVVEIQRSITRSKKYSAQRVKRYRARKGGL